MNTWTLLKLVLLALFLRSLPSILQYVRLIKFSMTIPGPSIFELAKKAKKEYILPWLKELRQRYGTTFRIWFGKDLIVFFTDPDDIKQILGSNTLLTKSRNYDLVRPWLGQGLLTSGGDAWHRRRKLLTPAFHFKILSEFKEPMEENCKILVSKLKERANGEPFDIYPYITLFALDVICETAMGIKKNAQLQTNSEYVKAVQDICRVMHQQSFSTWQRIEFLFNLSAPGRVRNEALKILHSETWRVIKLRRQMLKDANITTLTDAQKEDDTQSKKRLAFLDMLLLSQMEGVDLTDREIREEVDTFMFEGHDTTSSTIAFAIFELSQNADVQQKAYEEAVALEGSEKEPMPYLEAVIKESLRLYPPVAFFSRKVLEDFPVGKIVVPKGAGISTLAYMVHRDERFFPNPEKYDPDRFLIAEKDLHPFAFVGFSAGPRNCIGQKFAMLELKASLSYLLRNFEILPVANFKPLPLAELVMKSGNGVQVRLRSR